MSIFKPILIKTIGLVRGSHGREMWARTVGDHIWEVVLHLFGVMMREYQLPFQRPSFLIAKEVGRHSIKIKFSLYADEARWNTMQHKNNLCLCLQGKASEVFAALTQRDPDLDFFELVGKLERRFGVRELPETSQIEFQYARQGPEEDVLEWADRVSHMATLAYAALPDDFVEQQCIMRFCQGCMDK